MHKINLNSAFYYNWLAIHNKPQSWLADQLGITRPYLNMLLQGNRKIGPTLRDKVMQFFIDNDFNELFEITREK